MNIDRMLKLADVIENDGLKDKDIGFDMRWFSVETDIVKAILSDSAAKAPLKHSCGTSCCIAGYAVALWSDKPFEKDQEFDAMAILDLNSEQVQILFYDLSLTRETAAARIRQMAFEEYDRFNELKSSKPLEQTPNALTPVPVQV